MKALIITTALLLPLFFGGVSTASAQTCTDDTQCSAEEVCCPLPPTGLVKDCRTRTSCASVNPNFSATPEAEAPTGILENPIESDDLIELLLTVLRGIVRIAAIFLVFVFVWIGFQFAAAQGNEEKLRTARTTLMWSVIGAAILLGAETLANIIIATGSSI